MNKKRLPPKWKPIDTAPKDGTQVLSFEPNKNISQFTPEKGWIESIRFRKELEVWEDDEGNRLNPTHWQPLPDPPMTN